MKGQVLFFEQEGDVFRLIGKTPILNYSDALDVYANTQNPASQLIEGETSEEIKSKAIKNIDNMLNKEYVSMYVSPFL